MATIEAVSSGDFNNLEKFLKKMKRKEAFRMLSRFGERGVQALAAATPVDSGLTASSWSYEIDDSAGHYTIWWTNSNIQSGFNVAVGLQYGHGTGTGGYVQGTDYINPALRPVFQEAIETLWKEIQSS